MSTPTVREQQAKCKTLRSYCVATVEHFCMGNWVLGARIVELTQQLLHSHEIFTTGEVLAKELRKAQRRGEIRKRIRPGTVYVEYTACAPTGCLFDNATKHHGE